VTARLTLRVAPGAASTAVVGRHGNGWKLRVAAAPENGKANAAVVRLLAEVLDVPERDVAIVSGLGSRDKTVALTGIGDDEIERRLADACVAGR
jgi:uncharacterized protein (TIGR00251 family)